MVVERSDAGQSYPPLPIREIRKENSTLPAINLQMEQMNRQLTQLIVHLQKLNQQIQSLQEEIKNSHSPDSFRTTNVNNHENHNYLTKKSQSTEMKVRIIKRRRGMSKFVNGTFIFLLVIGIAAALFSAIILFFRGPAMI